MTTNDFLDLYRVDIEYAKTISKWKQVNPFKHYRKLILQSGERLNSINLKFYISTNIEVNNLTIDSGFNIEKYRKIIELLTNIRELTYNIIANPRSYTYTIKPFEFNNIEKLRIITPGDKSISLREFNKALGTISILTLEGGRINNDLLEKLNGMELTTLKMKKIESVQRLNMDYFVNVLKKPSLTYISIENEWHNNCHKHLTQCLMDHGQHIEYINFEIPTYNANFQNLQYDLPSKQLTVKCTIKNHTTFRNTIMLINTLKRNLNTGKNTCAKITLKVYFDAMFTFAYIDEDNQYNLVDLEEYVLENLAILKNMENINIFLSGIFKCDKLLKMQATECPF